MVGTHPWTELQTNVLNITFTTLLAGGLHPDGMFLLTFFARYAEVSVAAGTDEGIDVGLGAGASVHTRVTRTRRPRD